MLPRGAGHRSDGPRGEVQGFALMGLKTFRTLYSPAGPVTARTGPAGEYRVSHFRVITLYSPAGPVTARTGRGVQGFALLGLKTFRTLYSPVGPVTARTGPAGEYRVSHFWALKHSEPARTGPAREYRVSHF